MINPIALLIAVEVQQREVLERAKWQNRAQAAFNDKARVRQTQITLDPCGQTGRKNFLVKGTLS